MKIDKTRVIAALSLVVTAIIVWRRNTLQETIAELSWRASAVLSFVLTWLGQGASDGMTFLNHNAQGVSALASLVGLGFSIYFQIRNSKKT